MLLDYISTATAYKPGPSKFDHIGEQGEHLSTLQNRPGCMGTHKGLVIAIECIRHAVMVTERPSKPLAHYRTMSEVSDTDANFNCNADISSWRVLISLNRNMMPYDARYYPHDARYQPYAARRYPLAADFHTSG